MVQLKFVDTNEKPIGMISWFAVHPTSMNYTNKLISSDNVGYASILFEKKMNPRKSLIGKVSVTTYTYVFPQHFTISSDVRRVLFQGPFVAAFASTNLGDVSPNIMGARCQITGEECDPNTSRCPNNNELCVASGPGQNMFESTKIIAERLYGKAMVIVVNVVSKLSSTTRLVDILLLVRFAGIMELERYRIKRRDSFGSSIRPHAVANCRIHRSENRQHRNGKYRYRATTPLRHIGKLTISHVS